MLLPWLLAVHIDYGDWRILGPVVPKWSFSRVSVTNQDLNNVKTRRTNLSILDCKENKPIRSEGNQPRVLPGRTDPEAEAPMLWPSHEKRRLPGKDPDVRKERRQEEKGMTEDEMVGWCH